MRALGLEFIQLISEIRERIYSGRRGCHGISLILLERARPPRRSSHPNQLREIA